MDPKPEKLGQNITLKFRNLKAVRKEQIVLITLLFVGAWM